MLHFHKTNEFIGIFFRGGGRGYLRIITPYIRILDFDWLIAGVFFVYFHI
jgi:hypothetical protein